MAGGTAAGGAEGEAAGGRRDRAWFAARGFPGGPVGYAHAGFCALNSFSWIAPLLALGARGGVGEATAEAFVSEDFEAPVLAARFDAAYAELTVRSPTERLGCSSQSLKWPGSLARPLSRQQRNKLPEQGLRFRAEHQRGVIAGAVYVSVVGSAADASDSVSYLAGPRDKERW